MTVADGIKGANEWRADIIIPIRDGIHKFIQQLVIGLASDSFMPQPNVERVLQQCLQK